MYILETQSLCVHKLLSTRWNWE